MSREPKKARKSEGRLPKVSKKSKQALQLPPPEDDEETEDESWERPLSACLAQNLIMYLTKTNLSPENQEILKGVVQEYQDKLENHFYRQHSKVDAWHKVLEKFNHRM